MNVSHLNNDCKAIIDAADLCSPIKMPLAIQGIKDQTAYRPYPNRFAIVHNKTGRPFDICSDVYQIHKPATLVSAVCHSATEAGAHITNISTWHGGASIAIEGTIKGKGSEAEFRSAGELQARMDAGYKVGQRLSAGFAVRISNGVGNPTKVTALGREIACLNGLVSACVKQLSIINHRRGTEDVVFSLTSLMPELQRANDTVSQARARLVGIPSDEMTMRAYLLELSQPALFNEVVTATIGARGADTPEVKRDFYLESLMSSDLVARQLLNTIDDVERSNRLTRRMNDHLISQPLARESVGTLYQPYMAATYVVDHQGNGRGEFAQDNVQDNALFGAGREIKARALDLVLQYASVGALN